jgi:lactate dehydrogenase-like 2-hydroxyacid dehydrogenase
MQRLLITRRLPDRVLEAARARFDVTLRDRTEVLSPEELRAALRDYDAVLPTLGDRFQPDVFADVSAPVRGSLPTSGWATTTSTPAPRRLPGLAVTNTPGAVTDATADIALSLILMTARRLGEGERHPSRRGVGGLAPGADAGHPCHRKTLGIIGFGRIGKAIAKRCHYGFDMEVVFHNRSKRRGSRPARPAGGDGRGDGGGFRGGGSSRIEGNPSPDKCQGLGNDAENRHLREHQPG